MPEKKDLQDIIISIKNSPKNLNARSSLINSEIIEVKIEIELDVKTDKRMNIGARNLSLEIILSVP